MPRQLFHALIEPQIRADESVDDIVIAHVIVTGRKAGQPTRAVVDMRVVRDHKLGFSAMEETTGWHAAIVAHLMARGRIAAGAAARGAGDRQRRDRGGVALARHSQ